MKKPLITICGLLTVLSVGCSDVPTDLKDPVIEQPNTVELTKIDSLILTIDEDPDPLHMDYTPAVHELSELGTPAVEAVLPLLNGEDEMTRLHAQRVFEGVVMRKHGWVPGVGFSNPAMDDSIRSLLLSIGYDYELSGSERQESIERLNNWLNQQ